MASRSTFPPEVRLLYSGGYGLYGYAVLDPEGRALFSSRPDGSALFALDEQAVRDWYVRRRSTGAVLFGVSVARPTGDPTVFRPGWPGPRASRRDHDDVVSSFFPRVAWITFPILLLLLLIDIVIFRRALDSVREASMAAASIGPQRTEVRLPEQAVPTEVAPLVHAVNQALDRLEAGFRAQRDFTADMAHECARRWPSPARELIRWRPGSARPAPHRPRLHGAHCQPGARHRRAGKFPGR